MTEMTAITKSRRDFILHWGEMGSRWGINRTVAEVHALLQTSAKPLTAEAIAESLSVARSNVSTSIRELQSWGLVRATHVFGDRRTHYEALRDVWEMFRLIVDQRKKREIDPTLDMLRRCLAEADDRSPDAAQAKKRFEELYDFFAAIDDIYGDVRRLPSSGIKRLLQARGALRKLMTRGA